MTFIDTGQLRKQAEALERQAINYNRLTTELEDVASWLRSQQFKDVEQFQRTLAVQEEALEQQRRELLLFSGGLERICDRYENTEQKVSDYREQGSDLADSIIAPVDLWEIQERFRLLYGNMKLE